MRKTYRQTDASYDTEPTLLVLGAAKKTAAKQVILDFIGVAGMKTFKEIRDYLLVTLGYAEEFGGTGKDVKEVLTTMLETDETLQQTVRADQLFIEPAAE